MSLVDYIKDVPDYPKSGIIFKDITPLLENHAMFKNTINLFFQTAHYKYQITKVVAIDSRGFIFGAPLAQALGVGMVLARKKGKLPRETYQQSYDLEYGSDTLEIHKDSLSTEDRVLIIDDLLATGGTAEAVVKLVQQAGAKVELFACLIHLKELKGEKKLEKLGAPVFSILDY